MPFIKRILKLYGYSGLIGVLILTLSFGYGIWSDISFHVNNGTCDKTCAINAAIRLGLIVTPVVLGLPLAIKARYRINSIWLEKNGAPEPRNAETFNSLKKILRIKK